jgi:S-sulfo-L-cysteine synthase (O-acetyl-L-serine-dependent)
MDILGTIGNTPLVELRHLNPHPAVRLLAKLEGSNPGGSVKDRVALFLIDGAERRGELRPGMTILEATSGNTGIGLALVAACKGYRAAFTMSEGVSVERRRVLTAMGAEIILTPVEEGTDGAIREARRMVAESPGRYCMPDQFNSPDNALAHYEGTGAEILAQAGRIDAFVAGMGTTGTLMGVARRLREADPAVRIFGVEPVLGHRVQGLKNMSESIVPGIYDPSALTGKLTVEDDAAYEMARRLSAEEGIFCGMSSGAAMAGALRVAATMKSGTVVTLFPDRGDRYVTTPLYCNERCRMGACLAERCKACGSECKE